jgi:pimeloyl-ACP methyl ester carboxylesterase
MFPYPEKQFSTADGTLSYVEGPANGETIILLHGVGSRWQPFLPVMPGLSEHFHVFAIDLRGHGRSGHTPGEYRLEDYTRDIQTFIADKVQAPAVIYGHSLGALVAIHLAAQHPESARKLILGDPPLYYHNTRTQDTFWQKAFQDLLDFMLAYPDPEQMNATLAQNWPNMAPERREERVRSLEGLDPDVIRAVISDELMNGVSLASDVSEVDCPVLLLRGNPGLGSALREEDVTFALEHFADVSLLRMESVGHGIVPVSLLPELIEFIGGRSS